MGAVPTELRAFSLDGEAGREELGRVTAAGAQADVVVRKPRGSWQRTGTAELYGHADDPDIGVLRIDLEVA